MTPQERWSIVWAAIERMAFRPSLGEATRTWLSLFDCTIHELWELEPGDVPTERHTSFGVPLFSVICEYSVENAEKYVGSIRLTANQPRLLFTVHSDPTFVSKGGFPNEHRNYPRQDLTRNLEGDVKSVLNGMIFHPRNHTHLEEFGLMQSPANSPPLLTRREVRVSGGIENAFVFLFHLRYQFCLVSEETRDSEKRRLVDLFTTAIKEGKTHVPAGELFDIQR